MFVAGMLVVATAALGKIWASGLDAVRGRLDDLIGSGAGETGLLLGKGRLNLFPRNHKRHEYSLASTAGIGRQARQAFAAVNQLFNSEEQEVILNDASQSSSGSRAGGPRPL